MTRQSSATVYEEMRASEQKKSELIASQQEFNSQVVANETLQKSNAKKIGELETLQKTFDGILAPSVVVNP